MMAPSPRFFCILLILFVALACGGADSDRDRNVNTTSDSGQAMVACGPGLSCSDLQYCEWGDYDVCGGFGDEQGTCKARPTACDDAYAPVCGCDDVVYSSSCEAARAGVDLGGAGCEPPEGLFACGAEFCDASTHYCHETIWDGPTERECREIPPECGAAPGCPCLQQSFEDDCEGDVPSCEKADGGIVLTDCNMG